MIRLASGVIVRIVKMTISFPRGAMESRVTVSIAKAKAMLARWVRAAEDGDPVIITRHGKPVAALVPVEDVEQLERLRAAGPAGGLASLAGGWEDSDELVRSIDDAARKGQRAVEPLD